MEFRSSGMAVTSAWLPQCYLLLIAKLDAEVINASDAHPKGLLAVLRADRVDPKFSETRAKVG
jgi:hypothetical protein